MGYTLMNCLFSEAITGLCQYSNWYTTGGLFNPLTNNIFQVEPCVFYSKILLSYRLTISQRLIESVELDLCVFAGYSHYMC